MKSSSERILRGNPINWGKWEEGKSRNNEMHFVHSTKLLKRKVVVKNSRSKMIFSGSVLLSTVDVDQALKMVGGRMCTEAYVKNLMFCQVFQSFSL